MIYNCNLRKRESAGANILVEKVKVKRIIVSAAAVIAAIAVMSIAGVAQAKTSANYKIGDKIKSFTLRDDKGHTVRLSQYRGKVVVLDYWAWWCPGCNEEAPHLEREIWRKYKNKNVQVLGVAVEEGKHPAARFRKFRKAHGVTYPLLLDEPGVTLLKFGFVGLPQGIVIDSKGRYVSAPTTVAGFKASLKKLAGQTVRHRPAPSTKRVNIG